MGEDCDLRQVVVGGRGENCLSPKHPCAFNPPKCQHSGKVGS